MKKSELLRHVHFNDFIKVLRLENADIKASTVGARNLPLQFLRYIATNPHDTLKPMFLQNEDIALVYSLREALENNFQFYFYGINFIQKSAELRYVHLGKSNAEEVVSILTYWNIKQRFPKSMAFFSTQRTDFLHFIGIPIIPKTGDDINRLLELNDRVKLNVFNGGKMIDWIVPEEEGELHYRYKYISNIPYKNSESDYLHIWGKVQNHNRFIRGNSGRRKEVHGLFHQPGLDYSPVRK